MTTYRYLAAFRRYWLVVTATAAIAGLVAFALSLAATPLYTASAKIYFSFSVGGSATDLNQGANYIQSQMLSYAQLATTPVVLRPVIDDLGLAQNADELADSISVTVAQDTTMLEVSGSSRSAAEAARLTNALASSVVAAAKEVSPETPDEGASVTANVVASATDPAEPSSPNVPRNLLAGILIGLILGILGVILRERFDSRLRTMEDLETVSDVPVLGLIEHGSRKQHTPGLDNPTTMESYRRLCARLDSAPGTVKALSLLITSATLPESKSTVVLGIAAAFAERGRRVLVVDADIRRPRLAGLTGLDNSAGLTSVLAGDTDAAAAAQRWDDGGIDILLSGETPPRPGELLASKALPALLKKLATSYDVLIVDAAPVDTVADAMILGRYVQGAVIVADASRAHREPFVRAIDSLIGSHVKVRGVVLNQDHNLPLSAEHHQR